MHYPFTLPTLGFQFDHLEPNMDRQTVEIHYLKHHAGYVEKLNEAIKPHPELYDIRLSQLLEKQEAIPESAREAVLHQGGGHLNHSFFWELIIPESSPRPTRREQTDTLSALPQIVEEQLTKNFTTFENFKTEFNNVSTRLFGSGWSVLAFQIKTQKLEILELKNHETVPTKTHQGILICDLWEHAYYLKNQNRRADYLDSLWKIVNWEMVSKKLRLALR